MRVRRPTRKIVAKNGRTRANPAHEKSRCWSELMKHTVPSTEEEADAFVRFIYDLRRQSTPRTFPR